jgi:cellulose synthase/poly-beta-1,6-N-acetylglucosamine synthase-like glycosyltransferase
MKKSAHQNNNDNASLYYNSVEDTRSYGERINQERKKRESFSSQEIDINKYVLSPEGWESVVLTLYIIFIPYIVGVLFLFVFIAQVAFDKFLLLDMGSIFIVWAIGYEVIAITLLFIIFLAFLSYLSKSKKKNNQHHKHRY